MKKEELIVKMKHQWENWDTGSHEGVVEDALNLLYGHLGSPFFFERFSALNWQEQDTIINVLTAIRGP